MGISFRHSAGFGKRMEYNLIGQMLMEGVDVYLPLLICSTSVNLALQYLA